MKFKAFQPIDLKNTAFEIHEINLNCIAADPKQNRKVFDSTALDDLSNSIKNHGVIQPILVCQLDEGKGYQLIAGERRCRAAVMAGLTTIPAIIREYDDRSKMAVSLIENIQRENLNPLEEAEAIQSLIMEFSMTHQDVAQSIGKSRASVSNLLRLLQLTPKVKQLLNLGSLEMGHARALVNLPNENQISLSHEIISKSLSVRETEKLINNFKAKNNPTEKQLNAFHELKLKSWESSISTIITNQFNIKINKLGKGRITFNFDSVEEADSLIDSLFLFREEV